MVKEVVQEGRLVVFKDIEACLAYKDPSIPLAVDQHPPSPFIGCNTEEERLAAAIASPKPRLTPVRRALDRLARVPAWQDDVGKEESPPASPFATRSKKAAKRAATCEHDQSEEEDTSPIYQRLVDSCSVSLWNWIHKNELDAERAEASRLTKRQKERERKKRKEACEVAEKEAMNEGQQDDILERANEEAPG